ncbi:hypothetical protein QNN08_02295 [Escherichia fergusonii]|nr:hypothetical protein [Escherichia fergusonii]
MSPSIAADARSLRCRPASSSNSKSSWLASGRIVSLRREIPSRRTDWLVPICAKGRRSRQALPSGLRPTVPNSARFGAKRHADCLITPPDRFTTFVL